MGSSIAAGGTKEVDGFLTADGEVAGYCIVRRRERGIEWRGTNGNQKVYNTCLKHYSFVLWDLDTRGHYITLVINDHMH
jgi:hypothetical protein